EEGVVGRRRLGDAPDLVHHLGVDGEPAGGVDDADVPAEAAGLLDAGPGGLDGVTRPAEDRDADALAHRPQLLDGGRPLEVGTDEDRVAALLAEPAGE